MAKKKAAKKGTTKDTESTTATIDKPAPPAKGIVQLIDGAERMIEDFTGWRSPIEKQKLVVAGLQAKLDLEKQKLEHMAQPLRVMEKLLSPAMIKQLQETQPWDAELKRELGRIELKKSKYGYGKKDTPTGARAWGDMKRNGATDAEIGKNLESIPHRYGRNPDFHIEQTNFVHEPNGDFYPPPKTVLIKGKAALVKEARRVFAIPQPVKSATPPKPSPAATARKKKPVSKSKSPTAAKKAVKSKPAAMAKNSTAKKKSSKKGSTKKAKPGRADAVATVSDGDVIGHLAIDGPMTSYQLADKLKIGTPGLWPVLDRLVSEGTLTLKDGTYTVKDGTTKPAREMKQAHCAPTEELGGCQSLATVKQMGRCTSTEFARALGISVDAAGKRLGRMVASGTLKKDGNEFFAKDAGDGGEGAGSDPNKAADAAVNADFEQSLRERGKRRKEGAERAKANGWDVNVPTEDQAAADSLKNDEAWTEPSGGVVVDRRTKAKPKGFVATKPK